MYKQKSEKCLVEQKRGLLNSPAKHADMKTSHSARESEPLWIEILVPYFC